jgi:hypothetical protein
MGRVASPLPNEIETRLVASQLGSQEADCGLQYFLAISKHDRYVTLVGLLHVQHTKLRPNSQKRGTANGVKVNSALIGEVSWNILRRWMAVKGAVQLQFFNGDFSSPHAK